jgi:hypothetical protein
MGADVLLSLTDYDLDPNDEVVDDNVHAVVAAQNLNWIWRTWRGEFSDDVAVGVDYLKYAMQKSPDTRALSEDLLQNARRITPLTGVSVTSSAKVGRDVTLAFKARFNADTLAGNLLVTTEISEQAGAQSPIAPFLALHRG